MASRKRRQREESEETGASDNEGCSECGRKKSPSAQDEKLLAVLVRACPTEALEYTTEQARTWARNLQLSLEAKHGADKDAVRAQARSLAFNLKRNGENLSRFSPNDLVKLSPQELAQGTTAATMREKASLDGWDPPPPPTPLSKEFAWFAAAYSFGKQLVLVLCDDHIHRAYQRYFDGIPNVDVVKYDDITKLPGHCDAFVSPANTMGNMDGGVDRAYADYFGLSYGRPHHGPNPLQLCMDKAAGECNARLPIGEAILVRDDAHSTALIAAPTMALPGKIKTNSRVIYQAAFASLKIFRETDDLCVVRMPAFGTGWGQVPAEIAAAQTWQAFVAAWA